MHAKPGRLGDCPDGHRRGGGTDNPDLRPPDHRGRRRAAHLAGARGDPRTCRGVKRDDTDNNCRGSWPRDRGDPGCGLWQHGTDEEHRERYHCGAQEPRWRRTPGIHLDAHRRSNRGLQPDGQRRARTRGRCGGEHPVHDVADNVDGGGTPGLRDGGETCFEEVRGFGFFRAGDPVFLF